MIRPHFRKMDNVVLKSITGSNFMNDENINYGLIDVCDCCGDYFSIHNRHDGKNYLTWVEKRLYCQKCMADSFNGRTEISYVSYKRSTRLSATNLMHPW